MDSPAPRSLAAQENDIRELVRLGIAALTLAAI